MWFSSGVDSKPLKKQLFAFIYRFSVSNILLKFKKTTFLKSVSINAGFTGCFNLCSVMVNFKVFSVFWQVRFVSSIFTIAFFHVSTILPTKHLALTTLKLNTQFGNAY